MAEFVKITALPWSQLWRVNNPAVRADFLAEQREVYGNCPCTEPVDIYSDTAPELCRCDTGAKIGGGQDDQTQAGAVAGLVALPGLALLNRVPWWVWLALAGVVVIAATRDGRSGRFARA